MFLTYFENSTEILCYFLCYFLKSPEFGRSPEIREQATTLVVTSYRSLLLGLEPSQRSGLTVELLTLASLLQGENKWRKVREELEGEEGTLALVAATLRREGESQELVRKALVILKATDYSIMGEQEVEAAEQQEVVTMGPEQVPRLDQLLESVTEQLATYSLDSVLAVVVELAVAEDVIRELTYVVWDFVTPSKSRSYSSGS